jgi:hypothetical protein
MPVGVTQAIAGVSANRETRIEAVYPSVASTALGRLIGLLMGGVGAIPVTVVRLVGSVLIGSLLFPLGMLIYLLLKVLGSCWIVTNRSVQQRKVIGGGLVAEVALGDIGDFAVTQRTGYRFFRVGDLHLLDAQGDRLMTLSGIQYPDRVRHVIMDARDARLRSDESLQLIQARTA